MTTLSTLPYDVLALLPAYLDPLSLSSLSLTSKTLRTVSLPHLDARAETDGTWSFVSLVTKLHRERLLMEEGEEGGAKRTEGNGGGGTSGPKYCVGHCTAARAALPGGQGFKTTRRESDVDGGRSDGGATEARGLPSVVPDGRPATMQIRERRTTRGAKLRLLRCAGVEMWGRGVAGVGFVDPVENMMGTLSEAVHELRELEFIDTTLPCRLFEPLLVKLPRLTSLVLSGPHLDASALASLLSLATLRRTLRHLDVSGVKTCAHCKGVEGVRTAKEELATALAGLGGLKSLKVTGSRAFGKAEGEVWQEELLARLVAVGHSSAAAPFRLDSLSIHRVPCSGPALAAFLSSPACDDLTHLSLGGLKRVKAHHLFGALSSGRSTNANAKTRPLELELDGRLVGGTEGGRCVLDDDVRYRAVSLRLFEPEEEQQGLLDCLRLRAGEWPWLRRLVVLPRLGELEMTSSAGVPCALDDADAVRGYERLLETALEEGDFAAGRVDVRIGDERWKECLDRRARLEEWKREKAGEQEQGREEEAEEAGRGEVSEAMADMMRIARERNITVLFA